MKRYRVYPEETQFYYSTSTIVNWIPISVRKGFVELSEHWKYSSARNWQSDDNSIIQIQKLDAAFAYGAEAP